MRSWKGVAELADRARFVVDEGEGHTCGRDAQLAAVRPSRVRAEKNASGNTLCAIAVVNVQRSGAGRAVLSQHGGTNSQAQCQP